MKQAPTLQFAIDILDPSKLNSLPRINYLTARRTSKSYLEIGVNKGETFLNVKMPVKVGVDPDFKFDWQAAQGNGTQLMQVPSDEFFADLASGGPMAQAILKDMPGGKITFDIIFIDGLHTFEQSYRDFENSLAYAHENTVWILDDTVPSNPYSALPDMEFSMKIREAASYPLIDWCGDVYKTVFAIHDNHPEFSYCTLMGFNPQTVLWRSEPQKRKPAFSCMEEIDRQGYFDIFKHAELFVPVPDEEFPLLLGKQLTPGDYKSDTLWQRLVYMNLLYFRPKEFL